MRLLAVGVEPVGVVAIGANATGIIAIGQLATGGRAGPGMLVLSPRSPRLRIGLVVVLAALWWVAAGSWLVGSITEESGIFRDEPPPSCDDAGRLC